MPYVTPREAAKQLGVTYRTLLRWEAEGKIQTIKTLTGFRRFNVETAEKQPPKDKRKSYCYCRVSSRKQLPNLRNQIQFMKQKYPNHEIISDVASGLNYKRKGLQRILESARRGTLSEVVVAYKDRLARFGVELIEDTIKFRGGSLVVLNQCSDENSQELTDDLISIVTVFAARQHGKRRYKLHIEENQDSSDSESKEDNSELDGSG